ncbi:MAG: hypothetical protein ABRQ26_15855 [Syntrophomonadaceae bacterium]
MIWILIAIYVVILGLELPALLKRKTRLELWTFTAYFIIGLYMSLAFYYNWPLIEPFQALVNYVGSD